MSLKKLSCTDLSFNYDTFPTDIPWHPNQKPVPLVDLLGFEVYQSQTQTIKLYFFNKTEGLLVGLQLNSTTLSPIGSHKSFIVKKEVKKGPWIHTNTLYYGTSDGSIYSQDLLDGFSKLETSVPETVLDFVVAKGVQPRMLFINKDNNQNQALIYSSSVTFSEDSSINLLRSNNRIRLIQSSVFSHIVSVTSTISEERAQLNSKKHKKELPEQIRRRRRRSLADQTQVEDFYRFEIQSNAQGLPSLLEMNLTDISRNITGSASNQLDFYEFPEIILITSEEAREDIFYLFKATNFTLKTAAFAKTMPIQDTINFIAPLFSNPNASPGAIQLLFKASDLSNTTGTLVSKAVNQFNLSSLSCVFAMVIKDLPSLNYTAETLDASYSLVFDFRKLQSKKETLFMLVLVFGGIFVLIVILACCLLCINGEFIDEEYDFKKEKTSPNHSGFGKLFQIREVSNEFGSSQEADSGGDNTQSLDSEADDTEVERMFYTAEHNL